MYKKDAYLLSWPLARYFWLARRTRLLYLEKKLTLPLKLAKVKEEYTEQ